MIYGNSHILILPNTTEAQAFIESGFFEELDKWKAANQDSSYKEYKNIMVSDEEYDRMKDCIEIIESTEDYNEYKKAFSRLCYFCHIVPRGVILAKYDLKKGKKPDHNSLYVKYTYNTKRMELPEGTKLYHISKVAGIKELTPFFRGKSERGYKYDKPRIYFTVRKSMPKLMADYTGTEKMHMYLCKENIKSVFVDPMLWGYASGAVYVETNKPIKVEEVDRFRPSEDDDKKLKESTFNIDNFLGFVIENGLILIDE